MLTFRILVQIVWVGLLLVCVYLAIGVCIGAVNPRLIRPWLGVGFWGPGIVLGVPWESLGPSQWRAYLIPTGGWGCVGTAAVLAAVEQVKRVLKDAEKGSPFTAENAARARIAGFAILGSALAKACRDVSFGHFVATNIHVEGIEINYTTDLGLSTVFLSIIILAVAEVIRHGVRLQEEQDLTV